MMVIELMTNFFSEIMTFFANNGDAALWGKYIGAGLASLGCFGAGIGQGYATGKAVEAIGRNPEASSKIRTMLIIGCAIAETGAIYALVVALILIFVA